MSSSNKVNSRRSFFGKALWLVPAVGLQSCDSTVKEDKASASAAIDAPRKQVSPYIPKFFTQAEWSFVTALTGRLIPADADGPGAIDAGVPEFIDRQMETPYAYGGLWYMQGPFIEAAPELGYQSKLVPRDIVRLGIAGTEAICQQQFKKMFSELDQAQQETLMTRLEKGELELQAVPGKLFFGFMLHITREGFFSDPIHGGNRDMIGWKLIGFPGARADFMDFVNQAGAKYPLPPVSIAEANPTI